VTFSLAMLKSSRLFVNITFLKDGWGFLFLGLSGMLVGYACKI